MIEVDRHTAKYTNQPGRVQPVDAHSTLVVEFPKSRQVTSEPLSPEWNELQSVIQLLNERAVEWQRLNEAQVNPGDTNAIAVLQQQLRALDDKALQLRDDLARLGLSGRRLVEIILGKAPGITHPSTNGYLNLSQWATNRWAELRENAEAYEKRIAATRQVKVTVQAFRDSVTGERSVLHVDNWDSLPEGVYSPIDRTGLRPTEAEQKRLDMARQAAESVMTLINSAKTNDTRLRAALEKNFADLKQSLASLETQMERIAETWKTNQLESAKRELDQIAQDNNPDNVKQSAQRLKLALEAFNQDLTAIKKAVESAVALPDMLAPRGQLDPAALMFGPTSALNTLGTALETFRGLPARVVAWRERFREIEMDLQTLATKLKQDTTTWVSTHSRELLREFQEEFPVEAQAVVQLLSKLNPTALGSGGAVQILADAEARLIARTTDQLLDARLDLKRAGLALGDLVTIAVRATNSVTGQTVVADSFQHEVGFMGLHGKPAVHFIFARGLSGSDEATEWKPNVAASVEWHYTIREPQSACKKTWNWVYPGFGIHLASLDQTDDNFEMGAGGNLSLWDGLLAGGGGFNFSAERPYVWVGVNLLSALNKAKGAFAGK